MTSSDFDNFFGNMLVQVLLTILTALIIQLIARNFTDNIVRQVVRRHYRNSSQTEERKRENTLSSVFHTLGAVVIWVITLIVILFQLHINVAGLLTGAGVLGVIISLGAQGAIKDFLAGVFIIMENQLRVGDIVSLSAGVPGGVSGVVEDVTVRITKLRDLDGNLHIVPNGSAGVITNMTFQFANVNIDIPISYEVDIQKVKQIINDVGVELGGDKVFGPDITEAIQFLRVDSFGESTVMIKALGKVRAGTQWDVAGEFRGRLMYAFEKKHITIPYPHVVVNKTPAK